MKKFSLGIALAVAVFGVSAAARAQDSNATAIKELNQNFVTAWNAHDPKKMAAIWGDGEVSLINPFGMKCGSRTEVEKLFEQEQSGVMKASIYRIDSFTLRKVCDDVMVGDWDGTVTGMIDPSGTRLPAFSHHVTNVYYNRGGRWAVVDSRAFQLLPPPGAPAK
jgi:uncharacterized protein (TIGR02246 family)